jgi:hypothetical protein
MKRFFFRTIAWLCLIAHLNLIIPQLHEARAMEEDRDVCSNPVVSKKFPTEEQGSPLGSSVFNVSSLYTLTSEVLPLAIAAIYDDPFSYGLYKIGSLFLDYLQEGSSQKQATHVIIEKVEEIKEISQAIAPLLKSLPYLLAPLAIQAVFVNGGEHLEIPYEELCAGWLLPQNTTAPFLREINRNLTVHTSWEHGLYHPNTSYPVGDKDWETIYVTIKFQIQYFMQRYPDSMNASIRNFTRANGTFPTALISIVSSVEILEEFLLDFQTWFNHCNTYLSTFHYFTINNESLINASRKYYHVAAPTSPTPYTPNPIVITSGVIIGGLICCFVGIMAVSFKNSFRKNQVYTEIDSSELDKVSHNREGSQQ